MRSLLRLMKPDNFEDISAVGALYRPGPMGVNSHTNYALRKNGQQEITPIHPELEEPLRGDPRADLRPDRLPGAGAWRSRRSWPATRSARPTCSAGPWARRRRRSWTRSSSRSARAAGSAATPTRPIQARLGRPRPVRRLRLQQGALGRVRPGLLLDGLPQGELPGRVHGRAAHPRRRRQGQVGALPQRVPPDGHQGAAARRQRVGRRLRRRSARTSGSAWPRSATSATTWSRRSSRPARRRARSPASPTSCARCPRWSATSGPSSR